jgi:prepilin signal peptidase PulO-like enzyme (type II secretory pathway)
VSTALLLLAVAAAGLPAGTLLRAGARRLAARLPAVTPGPAWRPALAEVATAGVVAAIVAVHRDDPAELVLGLVLAAFLVPISLIDLDHMVIPNRLTGPAGAALAVPSLLHPSGIGMGDAKLLAVLGLFLGAAVLPAFGVAFLAGAIAGGAIMVRKGVAAGRKTPVAFGPFLALGGVAGVLAGDELVRLYMSAF